MPEPLKIGTLTEPPSAEEAAFLAPLEPPDPELERLGFDHARYEVRASRERLRRIFRHVQTERARVFQDKRLTTEGHHQAMREVGARALQDLAGIDRTLPRWDAALEALAAKLQPLQPPADPAAAELRSREIRAALRELPEHERLGIWERAVEELEEPVVRAVLGAPGFFKLLPAEFVESGLQRFAELRDPERGWELAALRSDLELLQRELRATRRAVPQAAGIELGAESAAVGESA